MPVKGLDAAIKRTTDITRDITEVRAERGVTAALITGQAYAGLLTPIDTSFLINSQFRSIKVQSGRVLGLVGYTASYAAAVHDRKTKSSGVKRPNGNGFFWDPSGEPQFLSKGFDDNRAAIDAAFYRVMKV